MRIFRRPTRADLVADGLALLWVLFYFTASAFMWRGFLALGFPWWLALPLVAACTLALQSRVRDARRRWARRRSS